MGRAAELTTRYPETMPAFTDARINTAHVRLIQDAGARLDDTLRGEFERVAVEACVGETPHRAKRVVERVAERLAPRSLTDRHRDAQDQRRVWREELPDRQELGMIHSAAIIDGIWDRLTQQARLLKTANTKAAKDTAAGLSPDPDGLGDPADARTLDQLRADVCADTLLTGAASGHDTTAGLLSAIQARVEVTVPVFTLMGPDLRANGRETSTGARSAFGVRTEQPGELAGGQPIDTDTARIVAGGAAGWERVLTHPITGAILAVDRYRPNADLRRLLHARDSRCRFTTCGMPPAAQDLDHTIDAASGGATAEGNLGGFCRQHHIVKHHTPLAGATTRRRDPRMDQPHRRDLHRPTTRTRHLHYPRTGSRSTTRRRVCIGCSTTAVLIAVSESGTRSRSAPISAQRIDRSQPGNMGAYAVRVSRAGTDHSGDGIRGESA